MTTPDVQDRLQRALGTAYTVERELGGGGMSRVFVADEAALGRKVVVKVLRPDLAEGLMEFVAYGREDPAMFTVMADWMAKLGRK